MRDLTPNADLAVHLTGPGGPRSAALIVDFAQVLRTLRSTLRHVERCITGAEATLEFEAADLSFGSANMTAAPSSQTGELDRELAARVVCVERETLSRLQAGQSVDPRLDDAAVRSFQGFCSPIGREGVRLGIGGVRLTGEYSIQIKTLLEPEPSEYGSVSGMLEAIDIHGGPKLTLYPPIEGEQVVCSFADEDQPEIEAALGRHVTVYGELFFRIGRPFPVRVSIEDASSIEVHPNDDGLPDLLDYWNNPVGPSGVDSVAAVRAMRNEW